MRLPVRAVGVLAHWVMGFATLAALIIRFQHSGKVCSGDYLEENESTEGYLIDQGFMAVSYTHLTLPTICSV